MGGPWQDPPSCAPPWSRAPAADVDARAHADERGDVFGDCMDLFDWIDRATRGLGLLVGGFHHGCLRHCAECFASRAAFEGVAGVFGLAKVLVVS